MAPKPQLLEMVEEVFWRRICSKSWYFRTFSTHSEHSHRDEVSFNEML